MSLSSCIGCVSCHPHQHEQLVNGLQNTFWQVLQQLIVDAVRGLVAQTLQLVFEQGVVLDLLFDAGSPLCRAPSLRVQLERCCYSLSPKDISCPTPQGVPEL
ncbi:TPA: hypothetical protein ACH3X1_006823 [Trebouxia sp. C0004]